MIGGVEAIVFTCTAILSRCSASRRLLLSALLFWGFNTAQARVEFSPCHNNYSPQAQIQLGDQSKAQVYKQMPVLPDNSAVSQYVQRLGSKLTQYAPGYKWPYNFHVVNTDEINAFALPGGSIFVNLGTIQAAENEAQLAGVMAHEISHVVLEHSVCNAEKEQRVGLLAGLGQVAIGVALGSGTAGQIAERGIEETTSLGFLKMSRGAEKQADLEGVGILYDAGYDPHGMSQFFSVIEAKYGEGGAQFLSDHPNPGNRTEYVDREIASFGVRATNVTTSPDFARIQKVAGSMHAYTQTEIASGVWKQNPPGSAPPGTKKKTQESATAAGTLDLSAPTRWKDVAVNGLTVEIPANWRVFRKEAEALTGPQGGIIRGTDGNARCVTHGLMIDVYRPGKDATSSAALAGLLHELTNDNPSVKTGEQREAKVGNVELQMVECTNRNAAGGAAEHYWIAALPETNGGLRYLAFVAPTGTFQQMRPTFHHILRSLTVQF
jgi:Zn-dependent protease with chaperone function